MLIIQSSEPVSTAVACSLVLLGQLTPLVSELLVLTASEGPSASVWLHQWLTQSAALCLCQC